jgi:diguanylate cyclase (GGDEF)-like protein
LEWIRAGCAERQAEGQEVELSVRVHGIAAAIVLAAACMTSTWAAPPPPRIFTSARAAHDLTPAQARRAYPVHLRVAATYFDPFIDGRHAALFVCDSSGCIFIRVQRPFSTPLRTGDVLEIDGVTAAGDYAPIVDPNSIRVVGHGSLPKTAIVATVPNLLSGRLDGQWVEVEGIVHAVHRAEHNVTLEIQTLEGGISAISVREPGGNYDSLRDALIRMRANEAPMFNNKLQMVGAHLYFPSLETVTVLSAAPSDAFAIPAEPISQLLQFTPGVQLAHRVRVQGRVTLQWPGRLLCIQQARDGMCVKTKQIDPVPVGALVDVIGFPDIQNFKPTVEDVNYRKSPGGDLPFAEPRPIDARQALTGDFDGELVEMEGELLGQDRATGDLTLMMRSGGVLISAILPGNAKLPDTSAWKDGSRIRVTGVSSVQVSVDRTIQNEGAARVDSAQVLLRSPADIRILATPSWWTTSNTLRVLALVVLIAFGAFVWAITLRRRVEQQTEALRQSEEQLRHMSQHDALTGLPNRILMNDRLAMAVKRMERFNSGLALMMVDLDRFKEVNDTLGHHAGDRVLCEVARRIQRLVRQTDTVARLGGDEFIVLLPDLHEAAEAERIAAKIVAAVAEPIDLDSEEFDISASVGVCTAPRTGADPERLLQAVDHAMYRAKARGKNCYHIDYGAAGQPVISRSV